MKKMTFLSAAAIALLLSATTGCRTGGAYLPKNATKYDYENQVNVVLMDKYVQRSVTCSGLQERVGADGRLEVSANIRNREARRIEVQTQCVFKDEQGFSTGDETPWTTLILTENGQETVQWVSLNDRARRYTIRVRQAH